MTSGVDVRGLCSILTLVSGLGDIDCLVQLFRALAKGALRKCSMLCIIIIGTIIDNLFGMDYVRNAIVFYFIATEGISILEHLIDMDVRVPYFIVKILDSMEKKYDDAEDGNNETD